MRTARRAAIAGLMAGAILLATGTGAGAESRSTVRFKADRILVLKSERRLLLLRDGEAVRAYPIRLGPNPVGPKIFALDGRTPEGRYVVDARKADSAYYRSLRISYPGPEERARAAKYGLPPGGNIRIHGTPRESGRYLGDWTDGCIAVSNSDMREIWDAVDIGTPVEIRP
jgi:murein L,D-transpeptidase YafK